MPQPAVLFLATLSPCLVGAEKGLTMKAGPQDTRRSDSMDLKLERLPHSVCVRICGERLYVDFFLQVG